ncbi:peptide-N-glycosidase F-related protein [Flavobacteriales bacterium]|nr:peptide-N-glycosidase F-related protein [Flavobacteriales bacterium]
MKKIILLISLFTLISFVNNAQSIGDTITVQSFDYNSQTRDTTVNFPTDTSIKYEKVLMLYNMRCKGARVSTGASRNLGCGEWDYSCNTYIYDNERYDSSNSVIPNFSISNYSGISFSYSATPLYDLHRKIEKKTTVISSTSEDIDTVGAGIISSVNIFKTEKNTGKSQFIYTATELIAAGITAGNIDALLLDIATTGSNVNQLKIKIKATSKITLKADSIDMSGFTEVFYTSTAMTSGLNKFQFHTPFVWNGTSNIILEFSFNGISTGTNNSVLCNSYTNGGINAGGDYSLIFDNSNYINANSYKGVGGDTNRTMEAWIKTTKQNGEILSWGSNATKEKWNWRTTNSGYQRIEINGAGVVGSINVADGNWHHVAAVLNGNSMAGIQFYVDGVLDTKSATSSTAINTNVTNGINVQANKGIHNRYLPGEVDGLRVWRTNVSLANLNDWKRRKINSTHPNYSNLEMSYELNQNGSSSVIDGSGKGNDGAIIGAQNRISFKGENLFKEITELNVRPNVHFAQGTYVLSTVNDTIYDSIAHSSHLVEGKQVYSKIGEKKNDSIATVSSNIYFNANEKTYIYDELGVLYDSISHTADGIITITNLPYWNRFPMKFEIMSFVTPYGIGLDLGVDGKTWVFDVTDYTPFLKGTQRLTMERGGQWQEEMDIKFLFIVGTPEREVIDIKEIWPISYPSYTDIISNKYFAPRKLPLETSGKHFAVKTSITGHGQEGEFIPRNHFLKVGPTKQYTWQVWKDCGENPVYPQGGTWIYDRAGWCPGMATDIEVSDISNEVNAGDSVEFDYGITTATGTSKYIVSNKLVTYGDYNHNLDAAIVDIISPSRRVEFTRENAICHYPKITIRNTGATVLTSLKIEFWVNNATSKQTYNWSGSLNPSEQEAVQMHSPGTLWDNVTGNNDVFHVEISKPNGGTDEYSYNNTYSNEFDSPDFVTSQFRIDYRSNNAASETSFKIYNELGTEIFSNSGQANNTLKRDTLNLGLGCYRLVVKDTDGDGIGFWANSDGTGYLRFHKMSGQAIMNIQADFGAEFTYNFTIGSPLAVREISNEVKVTIYPNPTEGSFTIEGKNMDESQVRLINNLGQEININPIYKKESVIINSTDLASGIYSVIVSKEEGIVTKKLVVK